MLRSTIAILLSAFIALTLWGCSDDSPTGPDMSEAPSSPSMEEVEMDFSIFEEAENYNSNWKAKSEDMSGFFPPAVQADEYPAYEYAALFASFAENYFQIMGQWPQIYFQENQWGDPEWDDGAWVWEWGMAAEGESVTMTVTARDVDGERHWELRYTTQGTDQDLDNALLIASQVRLDGSGGAWQLFDFYETEEPVFQVNYELDGDITTMVDMRFDEEEDGRFVYNRDGDMSTLVLHEVYSSGQTTLDWNNVDGYGSIQSPNYRDGNTVCWDDSYRETDC